MKIRRLLLATTAAVTFTLIGAGTHWSTAAAQVLSGQVTSSEEGAMEGVMVTAKKAGSTVAVSVASEADGKFSFRPPRSSPVITPFAFAPSVTSSMARRP